MKPHYAVVALALHLHAVAADLEFYGYTTDASPRAFLRRGARVVVAAEGDLVEDGCRLVRIDLNSVVVEDLSTEQRRRLPLASHFDIDEGPARPMPASVARSANPALPVAVKPIGVAPVSVAAAAPIANLEPPKSIRPHRRRHR